MSLSYGREGDGEPLLLVHGLGEDRRMWGPLIGRLSRTRDVIAVDLPGYGASAVPPPGTPGGASPLADASEKLLDELGISAAHVVGHSMGGWVALELARRGRALTVTAISPAGFYTNAGARNLVISVRLARVVARILASSSRVLLRSAVVRSLVFAQTMARPWRPPAEEAAGLLRTFAGASRLPIDLEAIARQRFAGADGISVPVLIAWGRRDWLLWPSQARRAQKLLPGAQLVYLPRCGHLPVWDDTELTLEILVAGSQVPQAVIGGCYKG